MLRVDEVLRVIEREVRAVTPVRVELGETLGRVLAEAVIMDVDSPPFDRSAVDGYALRAVDCVAGAELRVIGHVDAGVVFGGVVGEGECVGINTGAIMPRGADAVLMVEDSEEKGDAWGRVMRASRGVKVGTGLQRRGADAAAGAVVLEAGRRLGPVDLAVCAAAGLGEVLVRRVRVGVLTTGDELVMPVRGEIPAVGKLRNSNHPMLCALVRQAGGVLVDLGTCGDEAGELRRRLERGLAEADLVVVSGGMSMGTKDLVPPMLKELGVVFHVEKVRIKPGKPFVLGTLDGAGDEEGGRRRYVAGLPGNPVSGFVTFVRFVREMILRMEGLEGGLGLVEAETKGALAENGDREFYQPCLLRPEEGRGLVAEVMKWKGSADLFTLARAQGLVVRGAGEGAVDAGAVVRVMVLRVV